MFTELDTRALQRATRRLAAALDDELEACVVTVSDDVAYSAKVIHGFVNRTGRLEQSIETVPPTGVFTRGTLQAAVVATAPYAEFVERRADLAFLGPAWAANEARASQHLEDALERAVARSGWK
jgi:hypothetical protein